MLFCQVYFVELLIVENLFVLFRVVVGDHGKNCSALLRIFLSCFLFVKQLHIPSVTVHMFMMWCIKLVYWLSRLWPEQGVRYMRVVDGAAKDIGGKCIYNFSFSYFC